MADKGDNNVNLNALQRVDPYIVEVLSSATQVALYRYRLKENEWDKTGVEGTLFIYRRSAPPFYGFLIMNRLSKTNQVEPITKELELKKEDPYLMYRNFKLNIFGIWFYEAKDCVKICDVINRLLTFEKEKQPSQSQPRIRRASESDTGSGLNPKSADENPDIFSMLSKAQQIYLKSATIDPKPIGESPAAASADLVRPRAVRVGEATDVTRITPSSEPNVQGGEKMQLTIEDLFARACDVSTAPTGKGNSIKTKLETNSQHNPILQRLMSNPEHLVEHIEKRQRNEPLPLSLLNFTEENPRNIIASISSTDPKSSAESYSPTKSLMESVFTPAMFESLCTPDTGTPFMTPSKQPVPSTQDMALMSPMMFSTASPFVQERRTAPLLPEPEEVDVEPLTKAQLVQAFIHLLKTDSDVVNKLHEAYVQTLQRRGGTNNNNNNNSLLNTGGSLNGWENKSNGLF
ncbi:mRNA-decapping enzyme subunit 1 [Chamberlinius hualienensis]